MKILLCLAAGLLAALPAFAQKPVKGNLLTEINFDLNNTFSLPRNVPAVTTGIKARYFINDNTCLRAGLGGAYIFSQQAIADNVSNSTGKVQRQTATIGFYAGAERHFKGTQRLSPYIGADAGYYRLQYRTVFENTDDGRLFHNEYNKDEKSGLVNIAAKAVTGLDYYVVPHVFIGIEFGISCIWSITSKASIDYSGVAAPAQDYKGEAGFSGFSVNPYILNGFRIGYVF